MVLGLELGFRVRGVGVRVQGSGFRVQCKGARGEGGERKTANRRWRSVLNDTLVSLYYSPVGVEGVRCRVVRCWVQGLGFRVHGVGCMYARTCSV